MTRKSVSTLPGVMAAATLPVGLVIALAPNAHADTLPNGLIINCNQATQYHVNCVVTGCPRVGDYVVETLHETYLEIGLSGLSRQDERDFDCFHSQTAQYGYEIRSNPLQVNLQACRKFATSHDQCTPWSSYTFTPAPAPAVNPAPVAKPPANPGPPTYAPQPPQTLKVKGGPLPVYNIAHDDVKDPTNGVQGLKIATLPSGTVVTPEGVCKSGWCRIDSPLIPGGYGFALEQFLEY